MSTKQLVYQGLDAVRSEFWQDKQIQHKDQVQYHQVEAKRGGSQAMRGGAEKGLPLMHQQKWVKVRFWTPEISTRQLPKTQKNLDRPKKETMLLGLRVRILACNKLSNQKGHMMQFTIFWKLSEFPNLALVRLPLHQNYFYPPTSTIRNNILKIIQIKNYKVILLIYPVSTINFITITIVSESLQIVISFLVKQSRYFDSKETIENKRLKLNCLKNVNCAYPKNNTMFYMYCTSQLLMQKEAL
ncbi:unnamed protein product [Paramecium pentaurelia]|uniref:Uncharacterized protein n=1 Tax=Paramecium pentaurelia TaxID=43138 RepID=A0A8S1SZZ1_9CILI|nr:unnamed protein product [Paramecium pentaurelia]